MTIPNPRETVVLAVFFLLGNLGGCVYLAAGRTPSSRFILLYSVGVFWAIAAWIIADARRLGVALPFDIGWFAFFAWPLVLPYHVFKTRGLKGFVTLGALLAMFLATYLFGLVAYLIFVAIHVGP